MIYKITIQHSPNNCNKLLIAAKEIGLAVKYALKKAKDFGWKEAVVISSIEWNNETNQRKTINT